MRLLTLACATAIPLADQSVHCCVTSPPYWGLRDYGADGQLGLEKTPEEYVARMVDVFREVRRVLRDDGTLWLNLGDSYHRNPAKGGSGPNGKEGEYLGENYGEAVKARSTGTGVELREGETPVLHGGGRVARGVDSPGAESDQPQVHALASGRHTTLALKPKDLVGIPWRVAFALQADGWYLRSDIIWAKPNPMPESVRDRPTKAHEYLFLLTKSARYYYDAEAIREPHADAKGIDRFASSGGSADDFEKGSNQGFHGNGFAMKPGGREYNPAGRNKRTVWTVATAPYSGAHFATFPPKLIEPCILAGAPVGGIVLDPFVGSGTTVKVANEHGRKGVGLDISREYLALSRGRTNQPQERFA